jgi:hypothetical protein
MVAASDEVLLAGLLPFVVVQGRGGDREIIWQILQPLLEARRDEMRARPARSEETGDRDVIMQDFGHRLRETAHILCAHEHQPPFDDICRAGFFCRAGHLAEALAISESRLQADSEGADDSAFLRMAGGKGEEIFEEVLVRGDKIIIQHGDVRRGGMGSHVPAGATALIDGGAKQPIHRPCLVLAAIIPEEDLQRGGLLPQGREDAAEIAGTAVIQ